MSGSLPSYPFKPRDELGANQLNAEFASLQAQIANLGNALSIFQASQPRTSITFDFGGNQIVTPGTYVVTGDAPFQFTIASIDFSVGTAGGSYVVSLTINDIPVLGCQNVLVTVPLRVTSFATGQNLVFAGDVIKLIIGTVTGSPSNGYVVINSNPRLVSSNEATGITTANSIVLGSGGVFRQATGTITGSSSSVGNNVTLFPGTNFAQAFGTSACLGISPPLQLSYPGFTPDEVAVLNNNFLYLLGLIQQATTLIQRAATASGTAIVLGSGTIQNGLVGTITGTATLLGRSGSLFTIQSTGTITGTAAVSGSLTATSQTTGTITTLATLLGISNIATPTTGTITGTAAVSGAGGRMINITGTTTGTCVVSGSVSWSFNSTGTTTGTAVVAGVTQTQVESAEGFTAAFPAQTVFASQVPGAVGGTNLNQFSLPTNPGTISFNASPDTTATNVVMLLYHNHFVYRQTADNTWGQWQAANNWLSVGNPIPAPIMESINGDTVISVGDTIWASNTPGSAAPTNATVGTAANQLTTFAINANPGNIIQNQTVDTTNSSNVTKLAYQNHTLWQQNTAGNWFNWLGGAVGTTAPYAGPVATSPLATSPVIALFPQPDQTTNAAFVIAGTLQGYTVKPTLQYSDNGGAFTNFTSNTNVTNTDFAFVHPPFSSAVAPLVVTIRDANATTVTQNTNSFTVFTQGQVTLVSIAYVSNGQISSSTPIQSTVGTVTINTAPRNTPVTFSLSGPDAGKFQITGTTSGATVKNTVVLPVGSYTFVVTATLANAINNPLSTGTNTVTVINESAPGASVTSVNGLITGSSTPGTAGGQVVWQLVTATAPKTGFQITANNILQTASGSVTQMYYIGHTFYQFNGANWFSFNGTIDVNGQAGFSNNVPNPIPVITVSPSSFPPVTNSTVPVGTFPAELVGTVQVTAGGTNVVSFALSGQFGTSFSFANGGARVSTISGTAVTGGATAQLFTVAGNATPLGNYPITITATLI